ncbi:hypothetical protein BT63DRAFT_112152 [Microthyrium microscopicum]|uniref:Telomeric single stranded DNA binding POT1/Cdc13 domain-containing protein n=1 Tax=Microthyrium microscopicum TaxID=703497 RepID=A0A6A6TUQ3_9PEZI|nr:hypothetical protein BT63DRAFT_112152 [Microthyrium microscopicum]
MLVRVYSCSHSSTPHSTLRNYILSCHQLQIIAVEASPTRPVECSFKKPAIQYLLISVGQWPRSSNAMAILPIAALEDLPDDQLQSLKGVITLIWPFSSSTKKAAFLLSEPDFRLRHKKGQVRVQVQGPAALEVAKSKLSIGDDIILNLRGGRLVRAEQDVSTPGKSVDIELIYKASLGMQISRNGEPLATIDINTPQSPISSPRPDLIGDAVSTPTMEDAGFGTPVRAEIPLFHRKARKSAGSEVDSPIDPFNDTQGVENPRKRMRVSWGTPARWKLASLPPSPPKKRVDGDSFWIGNDDSDSDVEKDTGLENDNDGEDHEAVDSSATSPVSEAELTQMVEDARRDYGSEKLQGFKDDGPSSPVGFEPYRDTTDVPFDHTFNFHDMPGFGRMPSDLSNDMPSTALQSMQSAHTNVEELRAKSPEPVQSQPSSMLMEDQSMIANITDFGGLDRVPPDLPPFIAADLTMLEDLTAIESEVPMHDEEQSQIPVIEIDSSVETVPDNAGISIHDFTAPIESVMSTMAPPPPRSRPVTPKLEPVESTSLPIPSPFPQEDLTNPLDAALQDSPGKKSFRPKLKMTEMIPDLDFGFGFGSGDTQHLQPEESQFQLSVDAGKGNSLPEQSYTPTTTPPDLAFSEIMVGSSAAEDFHEDGEPSANVIDVESPTPGLNVTGSSPPKATKEDNVVPQRRSYVVQENEVGDVLARSFGTQSATKTTESVQPSSRSALLDLDITPSTSFDHLSNSFIGQEAQEPEKAGASFGEFTSAQLEEIFSKPVAPSNVDEGKEQRSPSMESAPDFRTYEDDDDGWMPLPDSSFHENPTQDFGISTPSVAGSPLEGQSFPTQPFGQAVNESFHDLSPIPEDSYFPPDIGQPSLPPPESQQTLDSPGFSFQSTVMGQNQSRSQGSTGTSFPPDLSRQTTAVSAASYLQEPKQKKRVAIVEDPIPHDSTEGPETDIQIAQSIEEDDVEQPEAQVSPFKMPHPPIMQSIEKTEPPSPDTRRGSTALSYTDTPFTPDPASTLMSVSQPSQFSQVDLLLPPSTPWPGLRTPMSYYVPLANLMTYMNASSQYDSSVDTLAIVYRETSVPARADKGRKDWYTKIRVTQPGFYPKTTLLQVFRPHKEDLPVASKGDVLLCRAFEVIGMKGGGAGMKTANGSAWVVFKGATKDKTKEESPRKKRKTAHAGEGEETELMSGPPVEYGDEERAEAERLKEWWTDLQAKKSRH